MVVGPVLCRTRMASTGMPFLDATVDGTRRKPLLPMLRNSHNRTYDSSPPLFLGPGVQWSGSGRVVLVQVNGLLVPKAGDALPAPRVDLTAPAGRPEAGIGIDAGPIRAGVRARAWRMHGHTWAGRRAVPHRLQNAARADWLLHSQDTLCGVDRQAA